MRPRTYALIVISIIAVVICVRLGFWQLSRLQERRTYNASVEGRLAQAPVFVTQVPRDTSEIRFRRVTLNGAYDYAHEIVLTNRSRKGSPGVNILTPLKLAGNDTAVLVNRGWIYAPDGMTADLSKWREGDSLIGNGYALPPGEPGTGSVRSSSADNAYRWIDFTALRESIPYPLLPYMIVLAVDDTTAEPDPNIPPRIPPPALDEGPHMSYAFQWFMFAVVFAAGMIIFVKKSSTSVR